MQGSCLSPILSALVLVSALYAIGSKLPANTKDSRFSEIIFIDDMSLTVSTASFSANNLLLRFLLPIVVIEFVRVGFTIGLDKLKLTQFPSKSYSGTSPLLVVSWDGKDYLVPLKSDAWRYLGFFLDPHLTFHYHVDFYTTKVLSTVKSYLGLGNSSCGLTSIMKHCLYLLCILPLMTYGYLLWFNPHRL